MPTTRFIAVKFKDAYTGTDEKAKLTREDRYRKHLELYKSRPYVLSVQGEFNMYPTQSFWLENELDLYFSPGVLGNQASGHNHGYHVGKHKIPKDDTLGTDLACIASMPL